MNRPGRFQVATALAGALVPLNSTIIAVALPDIRKEFHIGVAEVTLLVSAYLIAVAVAQPAAGRFGDALGWERVAAAGLTATIILSFAAASAWNYPVLVVARTLQGIAAAMVAANILAAIRARTPVERLGTALGRQGSAINAGAALGPLAGGALLTLGGWRALFIGGLIVSLCALVFLLPFARQAPAKRGPIQLFLGTQMALLVFFTGMTAAGVAIRFDSLPALAGAAAAIAIAVVTYYALYRRKGQGVVDLRLFTARNYAAAAAATAIGNLVFYTAFISIPAFIEDIRGAGHGTTSLVLFGGSAASVFVSPFAGRAADRVGAGRIAFYGACAVIAGTGVLLAAAWNSPALLLAPGMALISAAMSVAFAGQQSAALAAWPASLAGSVSGTFSMMRYVGSITGTAIAVAILGDSPSLDQYLVLFGVLVAFAGANLGAVLFLESPKSEPLIANQPATG